MWTPKARRWIIPCKRAASAPEMQADLTKMMFFARFTPATWFGQPTNGKVLVSFRRVNYTVRG